MSKVGEIWENDIKQVRERFMNAGEIVASEAMVDVDD